MCIAMCMGSFRGRPVHTLLIQGVIFKLHLKRDAVTTYVAIYTVYHRAVQEASGVTPLYMYVVGIIPLIVHVHDHLIHTYSQELYCLG